MATKKGDKVKIEYEGSFDDGTVFDSTQKHGAPLEFEVGSGQIIIGLDNAVEGMNKGEEKEVKVEAKGAYGDRNPGLLRPVPKDKFPQDKEIKEGMMLALVGPDGRQIPVKVAEVKENEVIIDMNHPLAGKNLNFKVKVTEINGE